MKERVAFEKIAFEASLSFLHFRKLDRVKACNPDVGEGSENPPPNFVNFCANDIAWLIRPTGLELHTTNERLLAIGGSPSLPP